MENLFFNLQDVLCELRKSHISNNTQIIKLLENVEKREYESKSQQHTILEEILQMLTKPTKETSEVDNHILISCVILVTHMQEQHKLPSFNESQFTDLWQWLLLQHNKNDANVVCKILIGIGKMFTMHPDFAKNHICMSLKLMLDNISCTTADVLLITTLQCSLNILNVLKQVGPSDEQRTLCGYMGQKLLQFHYCVPKTIYRSNISSLILFTFHILHGITTLCPKFAYQKIDELLGLSKTYFRFGIDESEISLLKPQKLCVSQQSLFDSSKETDFINPLDKAQNSGGKTLKTRKLRAVVKNTRPNECVASTCYLENRKEGLVFDIKVSDSELSEPENATNHILFERNRRAKIRLASFNLVGSIARIVDRKTLFGYWHALFPSGTTADSIDTLLYCGQHDPNIRCRSAALQVCAHLLYASKGYLHQAEINVTQCPRAFLPFSVTLGYTVLAIYKELAVILSTEPSLPVLTQALKCLAVLVQASTFKFEKGFVQNFVKYVKPLVYHRDAVIQVSSLMVMEFLVALPDTTCDIAEAIGLQQETTRNWRTNLKHVGDEEINITDMEELIGCEEEISVGKNHPAEECSSNQGVEANSWLLERVLYNLSKQNDVLPTSVRIESLQVLIVLISRFPIVKPNLMKICEVLVHALKDILPEIRLYAARCVDACAYQISNYLLNNSCSEVEIREYNKFWLNMMAFVMNRIQRDSEEIVTVRITLCDALSNIGVTMFEHTPHLSQISLLSFLSGVSSDSLEETSIRSAATRALAVFALYPSLRSDLVFIENTSELALRLVNDSNLLVRIKIFWSLGNISDALIGKTVEIAQLRYERISDDLLFRLITAATAACSDNDKVRCNAVRTLGNLLRLLNDNHLKSSCDRNLNWPQTFTKSICKLSDCIRSSGNAKVKWNACYAISNLMQNKTIFNVCDLSWQENVFPVLCHVIVHHPNFKVRINASTAITNITERTHFGIYYEQFWSSVLDALEQSNNLDNFLEYNHRDNLQEQLCLAISHIISLANNEDLPLLKKSILPRIEIICNIWKRVINRMVPEKVAPLLSCPVLLLERTKHLDDSSLEQKNILYFLIDLLRTE